MGKKNSNSETINDGEFNDETYWQCDDKKTEIEETGRGRGRGHGKGGSRGRGSNRGRTGFNNRNKDADDNNDYEDNDYGNQDNKNDRRKKTFAAREDNDEEEVQKPKEQYIPPELPSDEKLFENGVEIGINFDKYDNIQVNVS